ncbi:MAG: alanine racemase [Bryobacterales bacterium]|nr:alanine racemase [Bryobacterales bacterium]
MVAVPQNARCYVEISRSRIAANYRAVRDAVSPGGVIGVVKANAYGHGAVEVARVLASEGIGWLGVSSVEEGVTLRTARLTQRILVMAGVMKWEFEAVREFGLTPVVHSLDELQEFNERGPLQVHLKLDTGMDRLGTLAPAREIADALAKAPQVTVEGLLSHFASATDFSSEQTPEQIRMFHRKAAELKQLGVAPPLMHFASTNAVAYPRRDSWLSMVRPGHAIYGYVSPARGPAPAPVFQVKPALQWRARIVTVKEVPAGARVGYGGSYVTEAPARLAVLAAGYADGVPHRLSNKGRVIAGGRFAPMVGTVSMDLTTIDITQSPQLKPGDEVTLLGSEGSVSLDAQQVAKGAGTISYSVLCGISARVKRFYTD